MLSKFSNLSIRKILVVTSAYVRTDSGGGGGESQGNPTGGGECHLFLVWKSRGACGQPRFSWREIAWPSSLRLFSKTIVRQYSVVLNLKKHLISINGKKRFKRILVEGEKFKLRKLPSKDFTALFSSRRRACLVLKHNRVSEVFGGFKVHDFEYYGQRNYILKWKFNLCH